jgi:glycosyltransferase involved in cell wall biosynthesis
MSDAQSRQSGESVSGGAQLIEGRPPTSFSIVIPNYNYAGFVGAAIESALAADWERKEIIVVDDGSTDDSRSVIESYGDAVTAIFQENRGQREACNAGFAASSGDAVVFLDSDDVLMPGALRRVAAAWRPGLSKVQVRMARMNADGVPTGAEFPRFGSSPTSASIRRWYARTSAYPTPPGSGNFFSRDFLERVMPVGPDSDGFIDSALLASAPLYGHIATLDEGLVGYRIHGSNDSDLLADGSRFDREVARAVRRFSYARRQWRPSTPLDLRPLRRSRELLQLRVAARAMTPDQRSLPGDSDLRLVLDTLSSPLHPGPEKARHRVLVLVWCLAVLVAPRPAKRWAIHKRFARL